ncbi:MAG: hypothetical protein ACREA1_08795, partial [Nitrosotalea sp.]
DYLNTVQRNFVAMKQVLISNSNLIARRRDWVANTYYSAYANNIEMFSHTKSVNANGTITTDALTDFFIEGVNTTFTKDFTNSSILQLSGDGVTTFPEQREIVTVISDNGMYINSSFDYVYTANVPISVTNTYPSFVQNFYVRNSYDQVFVCLSNNNGSISNTMPQISLGGQLPTDPYIITTDGYKWKYLYTISAGLKQRYFTQDWMPVSSDTGVLSSVVSGRIDIVNILSGGIGYNNSSAAFSSPIITVSGDGTGANLTAKVDSNGTITGINIINGGTGYTTANIVVSSGLTGVGASIIPVIGPRGGWGSNAAFELGATSLMVNVDLSDTENATIPLVDALGNFFSYRQIVLLNNPMLTTGLAANSINYDLTTMISVSGNSPFAMNDLVYQSPTGLIANASFQGTVVYFDTNSNILHLNNTSGSLLLQSQMYATKNANSSPYATTTVFSQTLPLVQPFSGVVKYIENRVPVSRFPGQSESIRLILEF